MSPWPIFSLLYTSPPPPEPWTAACRRVRCEAASSPTFSATPFSPTFVATPKIKHLILRSPSLDMNDGFYGDSLVLWAVFIGFLSAAPKCPIASVAKKFRCGAKKNFVKKVSATPIEKSSARPWPWKCNFPLPF